MQVLERDVERGFVVYAESLGCLALKLSIAGFRGWPDRMVLLGGGRLVFFELKRPGRKAEKLQKYVHTIIRRFGFEVFVCDSLEEAKEKLKTAVQAARIPKEGD